MSVDIALSNYNAQLAYSRMTSFVDTFSSPITTKSSTYEGITDSVKLSARSLSAYSQEWIKGQLDKVATKNDTGEYKSVDEISLQYAEKLAGFASDVRKLWSSNGIALEGSVPVQTDGIGHIVCTDTENANCSKINQVLRGSLGVTSDFMNVAASESIVNHVKDNPEFIAEYADDPQKTMQDNVGLLRNYVLGMQIVVGRDSVTTERADPLYY